MTMQSGFLQDLTGSADGQTAHAVEQMEATEALVNVDEDSSDAELLEAAIQASVAADVLTATLALGPEPVTPGPELAVGNGRKRQKTRQQQWQSPYSVWSHYKPVPTTSPMVTLANNIKACELPAYQMHDPTTVISQSSYQKWWKKQLDTMFVNVGRGARVAYKRMRSPRDEYDSDSEEDIFTRPVTPVAKPRGRAIKPLIEKWIEPNPIVVDSDTESSSASMFVTVSLE